VKAPKSKEKLNFFLYILTLTYTLVFYCSIGLFNNVINLKIGDIIWRFNVCISRSITAKHMCELYEVIRKLRHALRKREVEDFLTSQLQDFFL